MSLKTQCTEEETEVTKYKCISNDPYNALTFYSNQQEVCLNFFLYNNYSNLPLHQISGV